ncbi:MAG TPA: hypothetical protein VJA40_02820 [archaeon]|nr:hypothetical protein [archaeon]
MAFPFNVVVTLAIITLLSVGAHWFYQLKLEKHRKVSSYLALMAFSFFLKLVFTQMGLFALPYWAAAEAVFLISLIGSISSFVDLTKINH